MLVSLPNPDIVEKDIEAVVKVMKTRFLSIGPKVVEFERRISEYAGIKYSVAVNGGISFLYLTIRGMEIGEGDVVITTPFSFIASSNCILFEGARDLFAKEYSNFYERCIN
jgi:perosamine synthetase